MNHNPRHEFYFEAAYLLHNMFKLQNYLASSVSALSTANNLTVSMFCCLATAGCFARGGFGSVPNGQDPQSADIGPRELRTFAVLQSMAILVLSCDL